MPPTPDGDGPTASRVPMWRLGEPYRSPVEKPFQIVGQRGSRGIALAWLFRQAFQANRLQVARQARPNFTQPGRLFADDLAQVSRSLLPENGGRPVSI